MPNTPAPLYPVYICTVCPFPMPPIPLAGLATLMEHDPAEFQDVTVLSVIEGPAGVLPKYAEKNFTLLKLDKADPIKGYKVMKVWDGWQRFSRRPGDETDPMINFTHLPAASLAKEWVEGWVDSTKVIEVASRQLGHIGIGRIAGPEPTPEELAALHLRHKYYNLHHVAIGDSYHAEGIKKFPASSVRAARELRLNRPWATSVEADSIACPYCGALCSRISIACSTCNKTRPDYYIELGMSIEDVKEVGDPAVVAYLEKRQAFRAKNQPQPAVPTAPVASPPSPPKVG